MGLLNQPHGSPWGAFTTNPNSDIFASFIFLCPFSIVNSNKMSPFCFIQKKSSGYITNRSQILKILVIDQSTNLAISVNFLIDWNPLSLRSIAFKADAYISRQVRPNLTISSSGSPLIPNLSGTPTNSIGTG